MFAVEDLLLALAAAALIFINLQSKCLYHEVIKITVASDLHHQNSSEASCSHKCLWWQWLFFVHIVTIFRNAQTTVESPFGLHFRCDWWLDPSPQHCSCSFRFKWLELIVPWGSLWFIGRVTYYYYYYYTGSHYVLKIEPSQYTHYYVTAIDMNEPFVVQSICFAPRIDKPPRRTIPAPI